MLEIPLSTIKSLGFDFGGAVDRHIKELEGHRFKTGVAAPTAPHPLVERAVARVQYPISDGKPDDFVADFKVLDDSPSLDERKVMLANSVIQDANKAVAAIMPPLKAAQWNFEVSDATAVPEKKRSAAHKSTLALHETRQRKLEVVHRHVAKLHSEIDDLTGATIDAWKAAPFPT